MIDVDYNEYKETLTENMKLIVENNRLKEELERLDAELKRYKSIVWLCEKVKDCDKK